MTPKVTSNNSIFIGTDTETNEKMFLGLRWLEERNVQIVGPPGEGKSRLLLWLYQCLCSIRKGTIILINPKGSLGRQARDWSLMNGHAKRVIWWDPRDRLVGYNPLLPNGSSVTRHTKMVREGIRAAWGQASFDTTAQLARFLFFGLGIARALELDLEYAVLVLRSGAQGKALRRKLLPELGRNPQHAFLYDFLAWFDSRSERWQDEICTSSLGRLEPFIADPLIAAMLTAPRSLDLGQVIDGHKILLVNMEINRPLGEDDVRLLGRLIINDIVSHAFGRPEGDRSPIYLICDEVHEFLTADLCRALEMGRELGLHAILSHQDLDQLRREDDNGKVYGAVMKCARIKALFGDCHTEDLDTMIRDMMIDGFDRMKVKDQRDALELNPIESTRDVVTSGWSIGGSLGVNTGTSSATARGRSHGNSRQWGGSHSHSDAASFVHSSATSSGISAGESVLPTGDIIAISNSIEGNTEVDASGTMTSDTFGEFQAEGVQNTTSETKIDGTQSGAGVSINGSLSRSTSRVPFYEYEKNRVVTSRTFESESEYLTECVKKAKAQPRGCFLLKLPKRPALFLRAPYVPDVKATSTRRNKKLEQVFSQPFYLSPASEPLHLSPMQSAAPMLESTDPPEEFGE
jgi:hypothetical protein